MGNLETKTLLQSSKTLFHFSVFSFFIPLYTSGLMTLKSSTQFQDGVFSPYQRLKWIHQEHTQKNDLQLSHPIQWPNIFHFHFQPVWHCYTWCSHYTLSIVNTVVFCYFSFQLLKLKTTSGTLVVTVFRGTNKCPHIRQLIHCDLRSWG